MKYLSGLIFLITNTLCAQNYLGLHLEKGSTYFQHTSSKVNIEQEVNGQKMNINSTVTGIMSFKVLAKSASYYELEAAYTQLGMTMKTPNGEMAFNSDKPADEKDIFSSLLHKLINHPFKMTMLTNGIVKQIKGTDSILTSLLNDVPGLDAAQKSQILEQLKQSYGENSLKGNIEQLTAIFPDKKVAVNEEWQNTIQLHSVIHAMVTNHFKLIEYNSGVATIESHAETKTNNDESKINGMPAIYHLSGATDSKIKVDAKTGWIIEADINQNLKGNLEIKDNPQVPGGMTIPMQFMITSKTSDK